METKSYWTETASLPVFDSLRQDLDADVVIIGGGLTGITAAYLLKKEGAKVVLLERQKCAHADTGRTTAHLTYVTDKRLNVLVQEWGRHGAKAFWEAGAAAIDEIYRITQAERIECGFKWVPGFLHGRLEGSDQADRDSLRKDADLALELGFKAQFMETVSGVDRPGVRFEAQAKFHPLQYLAPLLRVIPGKGSFVFENTEASRIESDPLTVHARGNKIRCRYLIIATHNPIMGQSGLVTATLFQTKLMLYTSYVLGAKLPSEMLPEALFWDTADPYYYARVDRHRDYDYLIFGGKDEKTGQETRPVFPELEAVLRRVFPSTAVCDRWLGQVVETNDGLPFIGENERRQFIATGFCGNGFTLGTLSAVMARDRFLGRHNPWYDLFAVGRKKFHGGTWRYLRENFDYPYYFLRDRLARTPEGSPADLQFGEGRIVEFEGKRVAAYRDADGKVTLLSPVCTHLGCIVRWNAADHTWDCPCHGSRFKPTGEVFAGPAESPLEKLPWPGQDEKRYDKAA
jgi:glycine/D-amino acid oxidase-like deaminating enzyme/nitrite reductase/ring-hydroxylating ferredoxin subunit